MQENQNSVLQTRKRRKKSFFKDPTLILWLVMTPAIVYTLLFHYLPMFGLVIAFKDYNSWLGIFDSPWAEMFGFKHFYDFIMMPNFWRLLWNTLGLSVTSLFFGTVLPIGFALLLNELRNPMFKRVMQTVSYAPYFISTVVMVSMMFIFCNTENGIINTVLKFFRFKPVAIMEEANLFVGAYVVSGVWQGLGWSAIIYVGTLANVDSTLHEAAVLDGANRFQRIIHINLPTVIPIMTIMLIMNVGNLLNVGFEKVYLMQTSGNIDSSNIIPTYIYEMTFAVDDPQFSYATAIGLFNSVINIILLSITNAICKKLGETSLW